LINLKIVVQSKANSTTDQCQFLQKNHKKKTKKKQKKKNFKKKKKKKKRWKHKLEYNSIGNIMIPCPA
jgi:hypothetical protein